MKRILYAFGLVLSGCMSVQAANHYVRAGATGNGSGSDWNNAYPQLPATPSEATLTRGDIYYIADGNYPGYTFDNRAASTQYITVKKATIGDHGTDTGWDNGYGDGQATFKDLSIMHSGYFVFDGVTGSGKVGATYGFKILKPDSSPTSSDNRISIYAWNKDISHIEIRHTEVEEWGVSPGGQACISTSVQPGGFSLSNFVIADNFLHDGQNGIHLGTAHDGIIERNYFKDNWSSSLQHGEQISQNNTFNMVLRYNVFENSNGTGVLGFHQDNHNWQIYGNISFKGLIGGNGAFGSANSGETGDMTNSLIYNNTFIDIIGSNTGIYAPLDSGNVAYNNLWYNCKKPAPYSDRGSVSIDASTTHDYNWFYGSGEENMVETHKQTGSGDPFVNSAGEDFRLKTHTDPGLDLGSPFNIDYAGNTRTFWDRGAYEYTTNKVRNAECEVRNEKLESTLPNPCHLNQFVSLIRHSQFGIRTSSVLSPRSSAFGLYDLVGNTFNNKSIKKSGIYLITSEKYKIAKKAVLLR